MTDGKISFEAGDSPRLVIEDTAALNECVERLFLACRRSLRVRTGRLDLDFYHSDSFTSACESIVTRGLNNELLFLVEDEQHLIRTNGRLVALARRFSSYIKIRVIPKAYIEHREMYVLCDDSSYLHQPNVDRPRGLLDTDDRGNVHRLNGRFRGLWDRSAQPSELFPTGL